MAGCINLEPLCAEYGMYFVDCLPESPKLKLTDKENVINKALGVLAENGFYAMGVFLLSANRSKDYAASVFDMVMALLNDPKLALTSSQNREDLPKLVLARKVTEQALTFARYHCKAKARQAG